MISGGLLVVGRRRLVEVVGFSGESEDDLRKRMQVVEG